MSGAFALLPYEAELQRGIYLTQREYWAVLIPGEDFELVVAESLHRNFVSKVLDKGLLGSLPGSVWKKDGVAALDVNHTRSDCLTGSSTLNIAELEAIEASELPKRGVFLN